MNLLAPLFQKKRPNLAQEWVFDSGSEISSGASAGFTDENSIVFGKADGKVACISSAGKLKWEFSIEGKVSEEESFFLSDEGMKKIKSTPIIADINRDGKGEVIFGTEHGTLHVLDCNGNSLWSFKAKDAISGSAAVADINNDGKNEILFGSSDSNFYALDNSGKQLWKQSCSSGIESKPGIHAKEKKIIFGSNDGRLYCLDFSGKNLWEFRAKEKIIAEPVFAFLNGNGESILFGSFDNNLYCTNMNGELRWNYKTEGRILSKPAVADINNDKKNEIAIGSCDDSVHVLSSVGKKLWAFESDFWIAAQVLIDDFDKDGNLEIAAGSYDDNLYMLEAKGRYTVDYIPGIAGIAGQPGHYSDIMTSEPGSFIGNVLSKIKLDGLIVAQMQTDEGIIAATNTGKVYMIKYLKV